jgi:hypothetical protein
MPTSTIISDIDEVTLGPLTNVQRTEIMFYATTLTPQARSLFRRLLILAQARGLESENIAHAAAQARAHFER